MLYFAVPDKLNVIIKLNKTKWNECTKTCFGLNARAVHPYLISICYLDIDIDIKIAIQYIAFYKPQQRFSAEFKSGECDSHSKIF